MNPESIHISTKNSILTGLKYIFYTGINFLLGIPNYVFYTLLFISLLIVDYYNFNLNPDTSIQLHTLKNFVAGNGISLTSIDANNAVIYQPVSLWPAGLVIFLTPFYLITKSTVTSALILKLFSNLFFILFLSKYLNYLKLENHKKKFIIFFFVVSIAPFVEFYFSDTIATVLCLWGFYFNLKYQDNNRYSNLLLSIFLLAISYFVKYSFLPFLFYPVLSFIFKEKLKAFKKLKQFIIIISATIALGLFFYYINSLLVGKMQMKTTLDAFEGNPHWNQLSRFDGFLFTFGIYEWVFQNLIRDHLGFNMQFNWISILVTLYFYIIFIKIFLKRNKEAIIPSRLNSINISLSAGALIMLFLSFLTINNPGQTWVKPYWTFVEETRYYGPVIVIGLINVLIIFLAQRKHSLLHIIIPLMFVFNLYAYRTVIQSGFWGKNYKYYTNIKKNVSDAMPENNDSKLAVVFFDKATKNSDQYYYLQSQGIILLDKSNSHTDNQNKNKFDYYSLRQDSTNTIKISPNN